MDGHGARNETKLWRRKRKKIEKVLFLLFTFALVVVSVSLPFLSFTDFDEWAKHSELYSLFFSSGKFFFPRSLGLPLIWAIEFLVCLSLWFYWNLGFFVCFDAFSCLIRNPELNLRYSLQIGAFCNLHAWHGRLIRFFFYWLSEYKKLQNPILCFFNLQESNIECYK